jgi:aromatic ring-opening dioxygenase catalytic subunit (LigB family)
MEVGHGPLSIFRLAVHANKASCDNTSNKSVLLVISAHWEERLPTVSTHPSPSLLFDYGGFPPAAYQLTWPAPGEPALAGRVQSLLEAAGIPSAADHQRGYDHGTFVPLKLAYPKAQVPVVQLSLQHGLDPHQHLAIGQAIAPLRDEGVFIIGSGMTFHNMRGFGPQGRDASLAFDTWLDDIMTLPAAQRNAALGDWSKAPAARLAHPREEHLLPLMVVAGAAGEDRAQRTYHDTYADVWLSSFRFG